jgi:hypothetical protein
MFVGMNGAAKDKMTGQFAYRYIMELYYFFYWYSINIDFSIMNVFLSLLIYWYLSISLGHQVSAL